MIYDKSREAVASAGEMLEDVVAEVRAEAQDRDAGAMQQPSADFAADNEFRKAAYTGNGQGNAASSPAVERGGPT